MADRLPLELLRDLRARIDAKCADWHDPELEDNIAIVRALDELIERRASDGNAERPASALPLGGV